MEFKRIAFYKVREVMDSYRIPILVGLRRTGKTTILNQINEEEDNAIIMRLDSLALGSLTTLELKNLIDAYIRKGKTTILLDEVQSRKDWDVLVKDLFDEYVVFKKIKVVVTGSSSLTFENRDTGVTRTAKVLITTMDYQEYIGMSGVEDSYENFEKYLGTGAFPEFINDEKTFEELMQLTLEPIINDDIASHYKINVGNFLRVLTNISLLTNGEVNINKMSKNIGIDNKQIVNYIDILCKTQLARIVYQVNELGQQSRKTKFKIYINPHFHLWLLNKTIQKVDPKFKGHIIESYWLFTATQINGYYKKFYYVKDRNNNEIDFATLDPSNAFKTLHELKYSDDAFNKNYKMITTTSSINKVVWCKQSKETELIKFESIKDFKNPSTVV